MEFGLCGHLIFELKLELSKLDEDLVDLRTEDHMRSFSTMSFRCSVRSLREWSSSDR